jgi:hypothetical protein
MLWQKGSFHQKRGFEEPCEPRRNRRNSCQLWLIFVANMGQPALVRSVKRAMLAGGDLPIVSANAPRSIQVSTSLITSTTGLLVIPL